MEPTQGEYYTAAKTVHGISLQDTLRMIASGQIPENKSEVFNGEDEERNEDEETILHVPD